MTLKHIDHLFESNRYRLDRCLNKPPGWFEDEIQNLEREYGYQISTPGEILYARQCNGSDGLANVIVPGKIYMFVYDPLLKCILPYYDIFPLVLVFETGEEWFRGLNLHHLPYQARTQLLGHLMKYATTTTLITREPLLSDQTKILQNTLDSIKRDGI